MANEGTTFCRKTGLNSKYCKHCEGILQARRERRPMTEKIFDVLVDYGAHSTREIAEQAGLMKDGKYPDIQRAIRMLRQEGNPIECLDAAASIYKLLTPEEAHSTDFWKRHEESVPKTKAVLDLETAVAKLEGEVARLREEKEFLEQYVKEQDDEIERLKSPQLAPSTE